MSRRWSKGALVLALVVLLGCGRTLSADHEHGSGADADGGVEGSGSSGTDRDGNVTTSGSGSAGSSSSSGTGPGRAGSGVDDDPATGGGSGTPPPVTTGGTGASGATGTGATGGSAQPPPIGSGSAGTPAPGGFKGPDASHILNPQECATEEPFVLSIDPGGASGEVRGWLESAPTVVFDEVGLPRFGSQFDATDPDALMLWWSISTLGDGETPPSLWLYTLNAETELAQLTVTSPAQIGDAKALPFVGWNGGLASVGPVQLEELAVLHHIPTDRFLALQVLDLFGTDASEQNGFCAAIEARWMIAPTGTGDFSGFE
jgi:hypothetical protein